jgi:NAD-dependent deacetylase
MVNSATEDVIICEVAKILCDARSVLFVTGAGISADSGLPTYRGVGGLYDSEETEDGVRIEDALSGPMFSRRPDLTWKYLWQIASSCVGAVPNAAHDIIAAIESEKDNVWVITQNVDGLHRFAGSKNLVEVHGNMYDLFCTACGHEYAASDLLSDFRDLPALPPKCTSCNGMVRPRVVLFEELLPQSVVQKLDALARTDFDVVLSVGTSAAFHYVKEPLVAAQQKNKPTVEINPTRTDISRSCRYRIQLGAADAMQRIRVHMIKP